MQYQMDKLVRYDPIIFWTLGIAAVFTYDPLMDIAIVLVDRVIY